MSINITLAQIHIEYGKVSANLGHVADIAGELPSGTLLLLPELWSSSYDLANTSQIAHENKDALKELALTARRAQIFIGGSLLEEIDGQIFNSFNLITPAGEIAAKYQKIHLFRLMDEHLWMQSGQHPAIFDFGGIKTGLAICYDLRFPELFRYYFTRGCKLILLSSEWPVRRIQHWKTLLQARAIENQCFVAATCNVGESGGAVYGGNSMIIDPWGRILAEGSQTEEQILSADIDSNIADEFRSMIPVQGDRRPELYDSWQ